MKERPEAAKRYETEWGELKGFVYEWGTSETPDDMKEAAEVWLYRTIYRHREQATALALQELARPTGFRAWWNRNWFALALLTMIGGGLVVIGLTNGWS